VWPPVTSRRPRVLLIGGNLSGGGGVNRVIRDVAVICAERLGCDTTVVSARSADPPTYRFPPTVKLEFRPEGRSLGHYLKILVGLRRRRYDYALSFWTQDNMLASLIFLGSRTRTIIAEHTSWNFHGALIRVFRRIVYPLAWRLLVLNPTEFAYYRRGERNVRLLPNPIPEEPVPVIDGRERLIVAVGHLEPRKNFQDAIVAMARSGLERSGWSLVIIGDGPDKRQLEELIDDLGLEKTRIVEPTSDLAQWWARASLTLVTARLEVFSLVLAEAMLAGVVPIAYATDGPSFILEKFPDLLHPIGDVDGLSATMRAFAANPPGEELRQEMRDEIRRRFSVDVIAGEWKDLLQ